MPTPALPPPATAPLPSPPSEKRDRNRTLRVVVSASERAEIERLAAVAGLSVSAYLRAAGLNHPIKSVYDLDAVRDLVAIAGDLGRLGGLMKLWLAEHRGEGAPVSAVNKCLENALELQSELKRKLKKL